jgi:hypothetical protein
MTRLFYICFVLCPSIIFAEDLIDLPDPRILGSKITSPNSVLIPNVDNRSLFPKEVRLIVSDGQISEIQVLYDGKVQLDQIEAAVNMSYPAAEMNKFQSTSIRLWKVVSKKFVIQLSSNDDGNLLIFTKMTSSPKLAP